MWKRKKKKFTGRLSSIFSLTGTSNTSQPIATGQENKSHLALVVPQSPTISHTKIGTQHSGLDSHGNWHALKTTNVEFCLWFRTDFKLAFDERGFQQSLMFKKMLVRKFISFKRDCLFFI